MKLDARKAKMSRSWLKLLPVRIKKSRCECSEKRLFIEWHNYQIHGTTAYHSVGLGDYSWVDTQTKEKSTSHQFLW